ncbi:MFS transporter [Gordoniibacillus kamchatkensis]|uniref:MFS transporter n=2 Tax=Gordoniibacillus kamchatkensis TaxID=1590651 RepID=A0ABR5AA76_9BACL|nr:MFS transporter [Paenibacillus sp. VKM B-2647]
MEEAERKGKFTPQTILLLVVNGLFAAANALSGTFVGVYLWKAKSNFAMIGFFTLCIYVAMALTFWLAGKWVKEYNKMYALRLGVAVSATFYLLVLLFGTRAVSYIWLLGTVQGMAAGFFWLAYNVVYFEVTGPKTRDRFNGWAGVLGSSAGMTAPWISGLVIVHMPGMTGYRTIFSVSLGIFLIGVIASFFLRNRKVQDDYAWGYMVTCLRQKQTPWHTVAAALVAQGFREGVFGFIIGLLVYISTADESKLGSFALITSAVSFASYWLVGKLLKPRLRKWGMLAGVLAMTLVIVPFFWQMSYLTLLVFGIGTALFFPMYSIPMTSSVFDLIGQSAESARRRVELIVMRELALSAGRVMGTSLFVAVTFWSKSPPVFTTLLLVIGASPLLSWWFMRGQFIAKAKSA